MKKTGVLYYFLYKKDCFPLFQVWSGLILRKLSRKVFGILAGFLVFFLLFPPLPFSASASARTTDYLNLRTGAGLNSAVLLTLGKNVEVTVLDNTDPQWTKVRTQSGKTGFCFKQYLSFSSAAPQVSSPASGTATTKANLNLRQEPSLGGAVLAVLPKSSSVSVLDNSNSAWARVQTSGGLQGWCSKLYLGFSEQPAKPVSSGQTATTTDYLNLRKGAGLSFAVIRTLSKGISISVLDSSSPLWVKVRAEDGQEGWCSREYLVLSGSQKTDPSPDKPVESGTAVTGAKVTADILRLRDRASTQGRILDNLPNGTVLKVLDSSLSGWIKVQTGGGKTGYVCAQYVTISSENPSENETSGQTDVQVSLSSSSFRLPAGKTLYLTADENPSGEDLSWKSSNPSAAEVQNGYVTAKSPGTAIITASCPGGSASCSVTVTSAEPVRTAFASPNIASPGAAVTLEAVTDTQRDGVCFEITSPDGKKETIPAGSPSIETTDGESTKVFKATASFDQPGLYTFTAVSSTGGRYSGTGASSDILVSSDGDFSLTSEEERRVSDKMLNLVAEWEGYSPAVYADRLASGGIPTVGYGCTFGANDTFYNHISKTEAWSLLVNRINHSSYTSELNRMIRENGFRMNQNQADCLISFAYNVGSGYFNCQQKIDFRQIMKNAVVPPEIPKGGRISGVVTKDAPLHAEKENSSSPLENVPSGEAVQVTGCDFSNPKDGWYQLSLPDGKTGWMNAGYVSLSGAENLTHDLNYTNAWAFGTELIRWNQAGGRFYAGLFYRRLGEANVYSYGDYSAARYNKYGYSYPPSADSLP